MKKENIWKYFKIGDIVQNPGIWGKKLFQIYKFGGNSYQPEIYVHEYGKLKTIGNQCNFNVTMTKLYDAPKRPLKKIDRSVVIKLMNKGNVEAKREFLIRVRQRILK